jgi:hypothetical protein
MCMVVNWGMVGIGGIGGGAPARLGFDIEGNEGCEFEDPDPKNLLFIFLSPILAAEP